MMTQLLHVHICTCCYLYDVSVYKLYIILYKQLITIFKVSDKQLSNIICYYKSHVCKLYLTKTVNYETWSNNLFLETGSLHGNVLIIRHQSC